VFATRVKRAAGEVRPRLRFGLGKPPVVVRVAGETDSVRARATGLAGHLIHHPDKPDGVFLIGVATSSWPPDSPHETSSRGPLAGSLPAAMRCAPSFARAVLAARSIGGHCAATWNPVQNALPAVRLPAELRPGEMSVVATSLWVAVKRLKTMSAFFLRRWVTFGQSGRSVIVTLGLDRNVAKC
jgi:hypothetical protein